MRETNLGDLGPTLTSISHLLQTKLLGRCPGSVGAAFLCGRGLSRALVFNRRHGLGRGSDRSGRSRDRDRRRGSRGLLGRRLRRLRRSGHDGRLW